jgi:hypothetical protein
VVVAAAGAGVVGGPVLAGAVVDAARPPALGPVVV